jgi:hypothetical protein
MAGHVVATIWPGFGALDVDVGDLIAAFFVVIPGDVRAVGVEAVVAGVKK